MSLVNVIGAYTSYRFFVTATSPLLFKVTQSLGAEPLKKKKRLDPMIVKLREERRKKKIEKAIRILSKQEDQLKPVAELEVPQKLVFEKEMRCRESVTLSEEEHDARDTLQREWSQYKYKQNLEENALIDRMLTAQLQALQELKKESPQLWLEAIHIDPTMLPYRTRGPLRTPSLKNYDPPDGDYFDITKKWE